MSTLSPVADDLTILEQHWDDTPTCEAPDGCDREAVARIIGLCGCPQVAVACWKHVAVTRAWIETRNLKCNDCGSRVNGCRVVPL